MAAAVAADGFWRLRLVFYCVLPSEVALPHGSPMPHFIVDAVPIFFLLMALEAIIAAHWQPVHLQYHLSDFLCSWMAGALQQLFELLCAVAGINFVLASYSFVYDHFRLVDLDVSAHPVATFAGLLLGVDFFYYWFHRVVHEYHTLYALGHSVHHAGEFYNLSASLRQGALQSVTSWPFFLPLALVFPPAAFSAHLQLNALYQIWPHTELLGRVGLLEYIVQTPSSHRMHHRPPGNCNYSGVFIIWDKLFGTFVPETTRQDWYGMAEQPKTFHLLALNMAHFQRMRRGLAGGLVSSLFARRVPWQWRFDPKAIVQPLPPLDGKTPTAPKRRKYLGPPSLSRLFRVSVGLTAIAVSYATLLLAAANACSPCQSAWLVAGSVGLLVGASYQIDSPSATAGGWGTAMGVLCLTGALGTFWPGVRIVT